MEIIYNKLVRDKIPEIIASQGNKAVIRTLSKEEYKKYLEEKLKEECSEVISSKNKKERLEELADVICVIKYLAKLEDENLENIIYLSNEKELERGGFDEKVFLEKVLRIKS